MKPIRWGIIGCGDVTELKSGPAFNKVSNSELVAVMRRNAEKAKDYARRHAVPKWYDDAKALIHDPDINAIYIATPPDSHEEYALAALNAGKPVYLEKPMTTDTASALRILKAVETTGQKLTVAHYRRAQPLFLKIREMIREKVIGETRFARLVINKKPLTKEELQVEKTTWRVDPARAGGGLFHDLSPHQLDLMIYFFGEVAGASGIHGNQGGIYAADDMVTGVIEFRNGVHFSGTWCFNGDPGDEEDLGEIAGSKGRITFSFFDQRPVTLVKEGKSETLSFEPLQHVQQPMIEQVAKYFRNEAPNPCSAAEGVEVMKLIDCFTGK